MARRKVEADDPWSGFVDVLSNVVMVVTFLVIILGIAMFALSQQVAKSIAADILRAQDSTTQVDDQVYAKIIEDAQSKAADAKEEAELKTAALDAALERAAKAEAALAAAQADAADARAKLAEAATLSEGRNRVSLDRPLLQRDEIEGDSDLTVRSRANERDYQTVVASAEEKAEDADGAVQVEQSDALMKIAYDASVFKLADEAREQIQQFLQPSVGGALIELRVFASSKIGSVSEARRIAYYRAMTVRQIAVSAGADPDKIKISMREAENQEDSDALWIFLKE